MDRPYVALFQSFEPLKVFLHYCHIHTLQHIYKHTHSCMMTQAQFEVQYLAQNNRHVDWRSREHWSNSLQPKQQPPDRIFVFFDYSIFDIHRQLSYLHDCEKETGNNQSLSMQ